MLRRLGESDAGDESLLAIGGRVRHSLRAPGVRRGRDRYDRATCASNRPRRRAVALSRSHRPRGRGGGGDHRGGPVLGSVSPAAK